MKNLPTLQQRHILRSSLREHRRKLTPNLQAQSSQKLCSRVALSLWFRQADHIAFYWPNNKDGEISPLPLLKLAQKLGKHCYLPVVQSQTMIFRKYCKGDKLYKGNYNIPEPLPKCRQIQVDCLDLIFVPLVGFDQKGNRLGMGGGFYDRALAKVSHTKPKRIGLAHQCQKVNEIPTEQWDIPLHQVVTNKQTIYF